MWPRCREQTFVPSSHGGSTQNWALIDQAVSEKKMFEHCGRTMYDGEKTEHGYSISSNREPVAQVR